MSSIPSTEVIKTIIGGPSDFGAGWIIILISSFITIALAVVGLYKWGYEKINERRKFLQKTLLLVIGTNIENFKVVLGSPVFINKIGEYDEFIFTNKYFYTQALVDPRGKIALYSITIKDEDFNPVLHIGGSSLSVTLGKTKFSDLVEHEPIKTYKRGGDHGGFDFYTEIHFFGRPGHYLEYGFSVNENGCGTFDYIPRSFLDDTPDNPTELATFRSKTYINTYTVIGHITLEEIETEKIEFGPKHSQIWHLNEWRTAIYN